MSRRERRQAERSEFINTPEPPVETQDPLVETQGRPDLYWPADRPLPVHYPKLRRGLIPCPKCRRVLTDVRGQAVSCMSSPAPDPKRPGVQIAYFRCKMCNHRWPMPIREVGGG